MQGTATVDGLSRKQAFGDAAEGRTMLRRLRAALFSLSSALWAALGPREPSLASLSDRQLRDLGLTRDDVACPLDRRGPAERDRQRMLRGLDWP